MKILEDSHNRKLLKEPSSTHSSKSEFGCDSDEYFKVYSGHRAGEDSLRGLFLKELRRRYEAAADENERETIISAVRFGLAAIDGRDLG